MTESELKQVLGQEIELPEVVEDRISQTCAQAAEGARPAPRKRPLKAVRIGAVAVAACVALSVGALAVSFASHGAVYQAFFGDETYPSLQYTWSDRTKDFEYMKQERVPVDEEQAEALVGAYLPDEDIVWQVGEYTMTIESYLVDENTGTAKVSYSLYRPGGVQGVMIDSDSSRVFGVDNGFGGTHLATMDNDPESYWYGTYFDMGGYDRVDQKRSTEDTLYIMSSLIAAKSWRVSDGLRMKFYDLSLVDTGSELIGVLDLPSVESLPAITITDPETGEPAAVVSAIGMLLDSGYLKDGDQPQYLSITFQDGSTYVVADDANNLQNTDHVLIGMDKNLRLVFNRLVDPEQVVSVTIDGTVYMR